MPLSLLCSSNNMAKPTSLGHLRHPSANSPVVSTRHLRTPRAQLSMKPLKIENANELGWVHEVELIVRDYELDQFGVVNNATYAHYCEHARLTAIKQMGVGADAIAGSGRALAMSDLSFQFISPLRSGDRFVVKVRLGGWSAARLYVDHYIAKLPNLEPILKARGTAVWLDENFRPSRIPSELISDLLKAQEIKEIQSQE